MLSRLSLKYRIAIIIFCLEAIMMATVLQQTQSRSFEASRTQISKNELAILDLVAEMSKSALITEEYSDLQSYFENLIIRTDATLLLLTDANKLVLVSSNPSYIGKQLPELKPQPDYIWRTRNIKSDFKLMGIVAIEFSTKELINAYTNSRNLGVTIALIGMLIIAGIGVLVGFLLTHRLEKITHTAQLLAGGNWQAQTNIQGKDELGELGSTFDNMVQLLLENKETLTKTLAKVQESENRLSITLDSIGDGVIVTDALGIITCINIEAEKLTGWTQSEASGRPIIEVFRIVNAQSREPVEHPVGRVLREGKIVGLANHTTLISKELDEYQIADSAAPIRKTDGTIIGVIMVFQNVTERYHLESQFRNTLNRLQALTSSLPDPCFVINKEGIYLEVLGGRDELFNHSREHLVGKKITESLPANKSAIIIDIIHQTLISGASHHLQYDLDTASGKVYFEGVTNRLERDGEFVVLWLARDITRQKLAEDDLQKLARFDQLTGLPNRRLILERLEQGLARAKRNNNYGAVLFIDIDNFKDVNDSLGHQQGDRLLITIAERLKSVIRIQDVASRFGGDEFVVLLEDLGLNHIQSSQRAEFIAEKLREACASEIKLSEHELHIELSIGIVIFSNEDLPDEILQLADTAMYKAKNTGRNRICFFSRELQEIAENRLHIQRDLRKGINNNELELFVQPKVDVQKNWVSGEVLVRWRHPERGLLPPSAFIPVAEQSNLITELDYWVISTTIKKLATFYTRLPETFTGISVNLSEPLMMQKGFIQDIKTLCMEAAIEPAMIEFEITERLLLSDHISASKIIDDLRQMGSRFSIDDFGTGCSSLRYLQRLPLDKLKIDKSFVDRLPNHTGDVALVETIINMANNLSMKHVAEGVETQQQYDFLVARGCNEFQGYLFSKPIPRNDFFGQIVD